VASLAPGAVRFAGGEAPVPYDAVILATGYRPAAAALLPDHPEALDPQGFPPAVVHPTLPGLFFVGFSSPATGLLREIGRDARRVARTIG
jgi:hypothetical protein